MTDRGWIAAGRSPRRGRSGVDPERSRESSAADAALPVEPPAEFTRAQRPPVPPRPPDPVERRPRLRPRLARGRRLGSRGATSPIRRSASPSAPTTPPRSSASPAAMDGWHGRPLGCGLRARGVRHLMYPGKFFAAFFEALGVRPVKAGQKTVPETLFGAPRTRRWWASSSGLFSADGTVRENPKANSSWIALTSKSRDLLRGVQLAAPQPRHQEQRDGPVAAGPRRPLRLPGEGRRPPSPRLRRGAVRAGRVRPLAGALPPRDRILTTTRSTGSSRSARRGPTARFSDPVVAVEPAGPRPVFDLTEPQSHSMIANGLVVHQCGEQPLLPNDACNLGSINVAKFAVERAGRLGGRLGRARARGAPRGALPRRRHRGEPVPAAPGRRDGEGQPARGPGHHGLGRPALHPRDPVRQRRGPRARGPADGLHQRQGATSSRRAWPRSAGRSRTGAARSTGPAGPCATRR